MAKYRLKRGQTHYARTKSNKRGSRLKKFVAGEVVELTEGQAHSFRDKFVKVGGDDEGFVAGLSVRRRADGSYDIVDETGKPVNDVGLSAEATKGLISDATVEGGVKVEEPAADDDDDLDLGLDDDDDDK